jgi:hypothetical protein
LVSPVSLMERGEEIAALSLLGRISEFDEHHPMTDR